MIRGVKTRWPPYRFLRIAEKEKKETRFRHGNLQGSFIVSIYNLSSFFFLFSLSLPSYLTIKYDVIRLRVAGIIKREGHAGRQLNSHEPCVHEGLRDFCRAFPRRRVFPCNFPDRPSPPLSQWKLTRHDKRKRPRNKRNDNWIPATTKIINRVFCIFSSSSSFLFSVSFFIRYIFNLESIPSILD